MYKNYTEKWGMSPGYIHKFLLIMRLTTVLLIATIMQVSASGFAQKITVHKDNATLDEVINDIRNQSGYDFIYKLGLLKKAKRITINVKDAELQDVLNYCFKDQPFTYELENRAVIVKEKTSSLAGLTLNLVQGLFRNIDVHGRVVDENGDPLSGATVKIKEDSRLTKTNANGEFTLKGVNPNAMLLISFVGYQDKTVKANENLSLLKLVKSEAKLDEVNVISTGYQKIEKYQLTGAASSISQATYDQRVSVTGNFLESLEGKIPGLVYNSQSGELSIRGISTFNAVKKPLIVLDGFPTEIDINTINPNDIVSISVLRDAAAASVYGVRASNGVIVIETKRGKSGKPVFSLRTTYAFQNKPDFNYLKLSNAEEFANIQFNHLLYSDNIPRFIFDLLSWPISPLQSAVFDFRDNLITRQQADAKIAEVGSYDNLKEYEKLFYRNKQAKQIDFDVSGGNDKNSYLLGLNYVGETPQERGSSNEHFILNMANTYKLSKWLGLDFRGTYTRTNSENGKTVSYNDFLPYEHLADDQGNPLPVLNMPGLQYIGAINTTNNDIIKAKGLYDQLYYPYAELTANTTKDKRDDLRFQARFNVKITDWLNLDLGGVYENENVLEEQLMTDKAYNVRSLLNFKAQVDPVTGGPLFSNLPQGDFFTRINTRNSGYTARGQFNVHYLTPNKLHDISGIVGIEQRKQAVSGYKTTAFGYDGQALINKPVNLQVLATTGPPAFPELGTGYGPGFNLDDYFADSYDDRRFLSYYSEGTYVYNRKYIATASVRLDRSNLFGTSPEYRNKPFWSVGLGWRLTEEPFVRSISWLNDLKLRGSYGINGNVPTSDNGPFLILQSGLNSRLNTAELYNDILSPENQSIRWESTTNSNLGLDYSLFNNKLSGTVDLYYKLAKDVFGQFSSDPTSGFNSYNANTASILNKGLELGINSINVSSKKFSWKSTLTATFNKNEVTEVKQTDNTSTMNLVSGTTIQKGYPIDALMSYRYNGLNEKGQPTVLTKDGESVVMGLVSQVDVKLEDLVYSGTTTPKYVLGLNNQFSVGNFDLSFLFMYYGGHVMRVEQPDPEAISSGRSLQGAGNYWKLSGDELKTNIPGLPVYGSPEDFDYGARAGYIYGSQFVRKADYIRLRDLTLVYHLKAAFVQKIGLSNTQLRLQGQNLWRYTFSGNDIDPEAINRRGGMRMLEQQPFYSLSIYTNF